VGNEYQCNILSRQSLFAFLSAALLERGKTAMVNLPSGGLCSIMMKVSVSVSLPVHSLVSETTCPNMKVQLPSASDLFLNELWHYISFLLPPPPKVMGDNVFTGVGM